MCNFLILFAIVYNFNILNIESDEEKNNSDNIFYLHSNQLPKELEIYVALKNNGSNCTLYKNCYLNANGELIDKKDIEDHDFVYLFNEQEVKKINNPYLFLNKIVYKNDENTLYNEKYRYLFFNFKRLFIQCKDEFNFLSRLLPENIQGEERECLIKKNAENYITNENNILQLLLLKLYTLAYSKKIIHKNHEYILYVFNQEPILGNRINNIITHTNHNSLYFLEDSETKSIVGFSRIVLYLNYDKKNLTGNDIVLYNTYPENNEINKSFAYIGLMLVDPHNRGGGAGDVLLKQMILDVLEYNKKNNGEIKKITLDTNIHHNPAAVYLYKKNNFIISSEKEGGAVSMVLNVSMESNE